MAANERETAPEPPSERFLRVQCEPRAVDEMCISDARVIDDRAQIRRCGVVDLVQPGAILGIAALDTIVQRLAHFQRGALPVRRRRPANLHAIPRRRGHRCHAQIGQGALGQRSDLRSCSFPPRVGRDLMNRIHQAAVQLKEYGKRNNTGHTGTDQQRRPPEQDPGFPRVHRRQHHKPEMPTNRPLS